MLLVFSYSNKYILHLIYQWCIIFVAYGSLSTIEILVYLVNLKPDIWL